ncbi:hypothetical protein CU669_01435 [Paramagnetospirillum kuznetsovii]|uniref:Histidine kinase n=1 Tax=Paramagnetospirillum kuznetsovii TaxID=2053833 RepID=A0A364P3C4_9PROT|nr:FIST C-terminal domain-containing protein [Paramagnetospirillum kuznetsovii]RAU23780.1 hypothetical protein CU669_01435 [Paramagnetospirillum kuznetsovii]
MSDAPFTTAHARASHWGLAAKACLDGLGNAPAAANLGFLYANEGFSADLSSILTFLRETTRIAHWVGGVAPGIFVDGSEYRGDFPGTGGALGVMVGHLPPELFHVFGGDWGTWPKEHFPSLGLVHGDPRDPGLMDSVEDLAACAGFLAGGLLSASGPPAQLADQVMAGGLSGILLESGIPALTGMTQGCSPIGPVHTVTEVWDGVVMRLDDRPALEVLKQDVGELLARDLRRIAGYIHVGLPVTDSDTPDYQVRTLIGIDPTHGWIAMGDRPDVGDPLIFVRRDANSAQADLKRMLADIKARLGNRPIRAGIYVSCTGRGAHMFGEEGAEAALLRETLGEFPLLGFFANGEISRDRLYGFTGVLTVIPGGDE